VYAACSVILDLEVIGFRFGIHYGDFWGHRGFTHSLVFAAFLVSTLMPIGFRQALPGLGGFLCGLLLSGDCQPRFLGLHD
jgi:membrane-bound metal-dependent hydrolase YbcI (DUF457 family)